MGDVFFILHNMGNSVHFFNPTLVIYSSVVQKTEIETSTVGVNGIFLMAL